MMDILIDDVKDFLCNTGFKRFEEVVGIEFTVDGLISVKIIHDSICGLYRLSSKIIKLKQDRTSYEYICGVTDKMKDGCVIDILVDAIKTCYSDAFEYYRNHPEHTPCHDQVSLADLNHGYLSTQAIPNAEKYGTFEFCIALNNRSDVKCKIVYNQSKAYSLRLADYDTDFDKIIDISVSSKYSFLTIEALFMFLIERYIFRDYGRVKLSLGSDHAYCKCSTDEEKPDYEQKYWDCQRRIDDYERNLSGYKGQIEKKSKIIQNLLHTNDILADANYNLKVTVEDLGKRIDSRDIGVQRRDEAIDALNREHKELDEAYTACLERIDELQKENDNLRKANEDFDNANERLKNKLNTIRDERIRYEQLIKDIRVGLGEAIGELKELFHDIDRSPYNRILVAESNLDQLISKIKLHICCCSHPDELSED